jgi:N-acetylmuramoyl-L-alanine amidase
MHQIFARTVRLVARLPGVLLPLLLALACQSINATDLRKITSEHRSDTTRLVLDLSGPVRHSLFMLDNPQRIVIDLNNTRMQTSTRGLSFAGSPISGVRHAVRNANDLRLVIDVSSQVKPRTFVENSKNGKRLVLDLGRAARAQSVVKSIANDSPRRDVVIAIDAGHGGDDPGAMGPWSKVHKRQLREKDVVLEIAKELKKQIEKQRGYRVVMIRNGDYFVPLKQRRNLARKYQADLMLSVHADAFTDKRAHGASVFAISNKGATSAMAAFLAQQENNADVIGGVNLSGKDDVLAEVLTDLSITASQEASLKVGKSVLRNMGRLGKLHSHRVEQAAFAVLKAPDIPAILVETGFISNSNEASKLADRKHQRKLASAIFSGIDDYFNDYPPPDTYLAWRKENRRSALFASND